MEVFVDTTHTETCGVEETAVLDDIRIVLVKKITIAISASITFPEPDRLKGDILWCFPIK